MKEKKQCNTYKNHSHKSSSGLQQTDDEDDDDDNKPLLNNIMYLTISAITILRDERDAFIPVIACLKIATPH